MLPIILWQTQCKLVRVMMMVNIAQISLTMLFPHQCLICDSQTPAGCSDSTDLWSRGMSHLVLATLSMLSQSLLRIHGETCDLDCCSRDIVALTWQDGLFDVAERMWCVSWRFVKWLGKVTLARGSCLLERLRPSSSYKVLEWMRSLQI